MADERDEWLDKDAAERLLRGEPVRPVGDRARAQAGRLSAALDGASRAGRPQHGELPGESAALAAFRKARAAAPPEPLTTVGLGYRVTAPSRWGRPVRIGLAGALAGVALGGVAVAAGTGVLPGPFGRNEPAPATSVSAAATPPPETGGAPTSEGDPAEPTADGTGTPGAADETPGQSDGDGEGGGTPESSAGPDAPTTDPDPTREGAPPTGGPGSGTWYRTMTDACRDYRAGHLAPEHQRRLEAAAADGRSVDRFCDRLLDGPERREDGSGSGDRDGNGRGDDRDDEGDGDGADRGDGDRDGGSEPDGSGGGQGAPGGVDRPVPPLSFTRPTPPV